MITFYDWYNQKLEESRDSRKAPKEDEYLDLFKRIYKDPDWDEVEWSGVSDDHPTADLLGTINGEEFILTYYKPIKSGRKAVTGYFFSHLEHFPKGMVIGPFDKEFMKKNPSDNFSEQKEAYEKMAEDGTLDRNLKELRKALKHLKSV